MRGLSHDTTRKLILSIGTHRSERPLSPVEVAESLQQAIDAGTERGELIDTLLLADPTMIERFIRLLDLPSQIQPLIEWGAGSSSLSFSTASELARLDTSQEQVALAQAVLENQLSKSEVQQVVQIHRRAGKPIEDCSRAVLEQRPVIERRHVIIGELRSEELKERLGRISQLQRNRLLQETLERHHPGISAFAAKLGKKHFVLMGDDHLHAAITSLEKGFEEVITEYLLLELGAKGWAP